VTHEAFDAIDDPRRITHARDQLCSWKEPAKRRHLAAPEATGVKNHFSAAGGIVVGYHAAKNALPCLIVKKYRRLFSITHCFEKRHEHFANWAGHTRVKPRILPQDGSQQCRP